MSKIIRLAISLAAVAGMTFTAVGTGAVSAHTAAKSKGTIAFLRPASDLYYQYGLNGAVAAAKKLGYKVLDFPNPGGSPSVEAQNVQNAVNDHVVGITGYSISFSAESATINKASAAHIPIFLLYGYQHSVLSNKYLVGFETVNLQLYGRPIGAYLKAHVKGQVAIITGQLGRGDAEGYQQGFLQGLRCKDASLTPKFPDSCGKVTVVDSQTGHWLRVDGHTTATNLITKYPNLHGMYVENEDMAVGAHTALVSAGKDKQVFMVSANGAPYGLAGIRAGWLKASDTDSPSLEGLFAIRFLDAFIHKKVKGGKLYYSHTVFVTKKNVKQAVGWNFYQHPKSIAHWMSVPLPKPIKNPPM